MVIGVDQRKLGFNVLQLTGDFGSRNCGFYVAAHLAKSRAAYRKRIVYDIV